MPDPYRQKLSRVRTPSRRQSRKPGKSPVMKGLQLMAIAATGGAVMLASLAGLAFMRSGTQFMDGVKMALTPKPPEDKTDIRTVVVKQMRGASELTTAVFTMEAVVPAESDRKLGDYTIAKTNLLYVAYGEVRAGVDLEELDSSDVSTSEDGTSVTLKLPAPKILDKKIDVNRSEVYDYSRGFLNLGPDRGLQLQGLAQQEAVKKIELAAVCEQNILGQANDRAELVITKLLMSTGFENIVIEPSEGDMSVCKV